MLYEPIKFIPTRLFNLDLYPKTYSPSIISKLLALLPIPIGLHALCIYFFEQPNNHALLYAVLLALISWYFVYAQFTLGYSVTLFPDKVTVKKTFYSYSVYRNEISSFSYWGLKLPHVKLVTKNRKRYFIHTDDYEKDDDFIDWFNTLSAETDEPLPYSN